MEKSKEKLNEVINEKSVSETSQSKSESEVNKEKSKSEVSESDKEQLTEDEENHQTDKPKVDPKDAENLLQVAFKNDILSKSGRGKYAITLDKLYEGKWDELVVIFTDYDKLNLLADILESEKVEEMKDFEEESVKENIKTKGPLMCVFNECGNDVSFYEVPSSDQKPYVIRKGANIPILSIPLWVKKSRYYRTMISDRQLIIKPLKK